MGKLLTLIFGIVIIAAITHIASVWLLPRAIMYRTMSRIAEAGINEIHFGKRPDETARGVVRPSPDLLYSTCPYDLSAGPLRVRSPVPNDTYWSVSLFDAATNNFYVRNDRQVYAGKSSVVDFVIVPPGSHEDTENMPRVESPSTKGLVLFRTLINDEKNLAAIDALRREASCTTWHASLNDVSSKKG
jgi:uncharacterized membrane protein